jgi:hypothetical protein
LNVMLKKLVRVVVVEKWIFKIFELYCEHKNL